MRGRYLGGMAALAFLVGLAIPRLVPKPPQRPSLEQRLAAAERRIAVLEARPTPPPACSCEPDPFVAGALLSHHRRLRRIERAYPVGIR